MQPVTRREWLPREGAPEGVQRLVDSSIPALEARILANRGIVDPEVADLFLCPALKALHDPMTLTGMPAAVERLAQAVSRGETVCVHGDYDVDGVTSVALLISFFEEIGLNAFPYIPKRLTEGYGLSDLGVEAARVRGTAVMVTVDCGISSVAEALLCRGAGIDLIVTDHHAPPETLPDAYAVINPHQTGCQYPFKELAGVGVAFNLLVALRARLRRDGHFPPGKEPDLRRYLDLVALGTIADVVPLLGLNRVLVSYGLKELTAEKRVGIKALKEVSGATGEVGCGAVGFRLAPRLNAAGRLEDAALGLKLLLTEDPDQAREIAQQLDDSNAQRQALERAMLEEARQMLTSGAYKGRKSIVLASEEWHPGVIGIVASRIAEMFHRPVVLFALQNGAGRGSGRSISRFHLLDAIRECEEHLVRFGGHSHAAGLSIEESRLERFIEEFEAAAGRVLDDDLLTPRLYYDAEITPRDLDLALPERLERLKPFGMGNPEPLFLLRGATVVSTRVLKGGHLKLDLSCGGKRLEAIAFGLAEREPAGNRLDLVFAPTVNVWNGRTRLQLVVKDFREVAAAC
ncbi:single-stranded-DNA-specific exonuclease RecJ [Geomesophilobacter sediminis]|uniref:Single-stranded-DNA-specific exonuclease RecJ n=1 Tax=Geomesophilobacter sediminis TaxID=2798584 RepID=A0A8J7LUB2_9BACT|nr:single-stranded-DNA-specific exonuclease RecJ [Geomesophilobacter sediminis]MBJ6723565.1 single-stranded-DNA-specific exonuclease RecJ [Geomesophilobacter sediminis]